MVPSIKKYFIPPGRVKGLVIIFFTFQTLVKNNDETIGFEGQTFIHMKSSMEFLKTFSYASVFLVILT